MALHHFPRDNGLERLRRRDEDVGRARGLPPSIGLRRVAMTDGSGEIRRRDEVPDAIDHVSVQGTERCHIDGSDAIALAPRQGLQNWQHCSFGFPRTGRCDDENV